MMQRYLLIVLILLLSGVLGWMVIAWQPEHQEAVDNDLINAPAGGEFTLDSYRGSVSLSDFRGKVVLLYFGYTWCPDICPTNLSIISAVLNEMSDEELERVQPVFVSVDPERDTVLRLKEYVAYFHPSLLGLTGSESVLTEITKRYGAAYRIVKEEGQANYVVDHSADTYLIDQNGQLVKALPHGYPAIDLLQSIRDLL
jgi:protein SCO1